MAKIGLSNTIPPLPFLPISQFLPNSWYWDYPPKGEYTKEALTWRAARGHGCSKSGDKERCSSHLPLEGRPGPQQVLMKAGSEWNAYTLQAKRCKREERAKSVHTCARTHVCMCVHMCACACVYNDFLSYNSIREHNLPS